MAHPLVGFLTLRMVIWLGGVIVAPVILMVLSKQKEIKGELDYFESLVLSLLFVIIAFAPIVFFKGVFLPIFKRNLKTISLVWAIAGFFVDAYLLNMYKRIGYWKAFLVWLLTFIVSYSGGFVLASFTIFLLKALR
jgi:hypothetical protein